MLLGGIALITCALFGMPTDNNNDFTVFFAGCCLIICAIFGYTIPVVIQHFANIDNNTEQMQKYLESIDKHICKIGQYQCDVLHEIHSNLS